MAGKSEQLQIRVSRADKTRLRRLAERAGQDISTYVLARALPGARLRFDAAVRSLREAESRRFGFAEIVDVLRASSPGELHIELVPDALSELTDVTKNYLAALVEQACARSGTPMPAWTHAITPLDEPYFGAPLRSLRLHLLLTSPAVFKRRNLFVDPGTSGRV